MILSDSLFGMKLHRGMNVLLAILLVVAVSAIAQVQCREMHARVLLYSILDDSSVGTLMFDQTSPTGISMNQMNVKLPIGRYVLTVYEYDYEKRLLGFASIGKKMQFDLNVDFALCVWKVGETYVEQLLLKQQPTLIPHSENSIVGRAIVVTKFQQDDDDFLVHAVAYGFVESYATVLLYLNSAAKNYHAGSIEFIQSHPTESVRMDVFLTHLPIGPHAITLHEKNSMLDGCNSLGTFLRDIAGVFIKSYSSNFYHLNLDEITYSDSNKTLQVFSDNVSLLPNAPYTIFNRSIAIHPARSPGQRYPLDQTAVACGNVE